MFSKILMALDGSDHAGKALDTAIQLAQRCDAGLILFHSVQLAHLSPGYAATMPRSARDV
jgi:nucleotide-binding universal stress UspA family protein